MGYSRWKEDEWSSYATTTRACKSTAEIFVSKSAKPYLNPTSFAIRESRDSQLNPLSTPLMVGLDVTGSMGIIAQKMATEGLGKLFEGVLDRAPITDPHLMFMAIGDIFHDRSPLQASQFESDISIGQQLKDIFLEGGGGPNNFESYDLAWYFAAKRTSIDCYEKRGKKGYLFTIGDEMPPTKGLTGYQLEELGDRDRIDYTAQELLDMANEKYNVYHIIVEQGNYARRALEPVTSAWKQLIGPGAICLSDYNYIAEAIISVMEVNEGKDPVDVIQSWPKEVQKVVARALGK